MNDQKTLQSVTNKGGSCSMIRFKHPEPISYHNQAKYWVDETNNQWHDPITLSFFEGQIGGLQDNLHIVWRSQKQMQQM